MFYLEMLAQSWVVQNSQVSAVTQSINYESWRAKCVRCGTRTGYVTAVRTGLFTKLCNGCCNDFRHTYSCTVHCTRMYIVHIQCTLHILSMWYTIYCAEDDSYYAELYFLIEVWKEINCWNIVHKPNLFSYFWYIVIVLSKFHQPPGLNFRYFPDVNVLVRVCDFMKDEPLRARPKSGNDWQWKHTDGYIPAHCPISAITIYPDIKSLKLEINTYRYIILNKPSSCSQLSDVREIALN